MQRRYVLAGLVVLSVGCGGTDPPAVTPTPPASASVTAEAPKPAVPVSPSDEDLLWLEEVRGEKALAFARAHNTVSEGELTGKPGFKALEERLFSIHGSKERIPGPSVHGTSVRNFWTDSDHPRGLWRQTTLAEYKKKTPAWTTLLDIDALNKEEKESFVWHGSTCLPPAYTRCLLRLSRGGGDADVVREFDTTKKAFVKDGFVLPEAKSSSHWKDENTIYIGTDFGPGSMTKSGYARIAKEWKRGTPLAEAKTIFEVGEDDIRADCWREFDHNKKHDVCRRRVDFEHQQQSIVRAAKLTRIETPDDANVTVWGDDLVVRLRSDWTVGATTHKKGQLLITRLEAFMTGKRDFQVLFDPDAKSSLKDWQPTHDTLVLNVLTDVKNKVSIFTRKGEKWTGTPVDLGAGEIHSYAFDDDVSDDLWVYNEDFASPSTLSLWNAKTKKSEPVKSLPSFFDAKDIETTQHFATSKDGTKIPYFEVGRKTRSGPSATMLNAYGGFEISMTPNYGGVRGAAWLEKGGVYVLANIRGGGEYGPAWHDAAMKHKRQNAYDDLAAVAEDLIKRNVTTAKQLGVIGGSNGGLLTSVMLTQRPELFGAIVSMVPLTDMKRFHKMLAGNSWMSEYGNPDVAEDWASLAKYSPFHNVKAGALYPPTFYVTSTKDDRVHPAHARKMVARLEALGHKPLYYENIEGGHGGAADNKQSAYRDALVYTFFRSRLGLD